MQREIRRERQRKIQQGRKRWQHTAAQLVLPPVAVLGLLLGVSASGLANPTDGTVTAGAGTITSGGSITTVTQTSDKLAVNWQSFSIGSGETVNFVQPGSSSIALNRVIGTDASAIYGTLNANGQVFLINPNGILFSATAQVNVGGIVAATLNLSDSDFLGGNYTFSGDSAAAVINQGTMTAADGGYVALLGSRVDNEGVIVARAGMVALGAGNEIALDFDGDGLLSLTVDQGAVDALAENKNLIQADGGLVLMTSRAADSLTTAAVNNSGVIRAQSISNVNGEIVLDAGANGAVVNSGTLDASGVGSGETGGTVKVLGDTVGLNDGSLVNVSGDSGGGTALIGGNYQGSGTEQHATLTTVADEATINADAITNGDGGTVVVWADATTSFDGTITARGGSESGVGGSVETSGHNQLTVGNSVTVNTTAVNGETGSWLLDPADFTIATSGGDMTGATLSTNLATSDVTILSGSGTVNTSGSGDIFVNDTIGWATGTTLKLSAYRNIEINAAIANSGSGSLALRADNTGAGTGKVIRGGFGSVTLTDGSALIYYDPDSYTNPDDFGWVNAGGGTTVYMLVNSITDLQAMNTNLGGAYALGRDIDATDTKNWNGEAGFEPIGTFSGVFDGLDHTINGLTVKRPTTGDVGLFSVVANGAVIENVGLVGGSVTGGNSTGGIAGYNAGTITNCYNTGTVTGSGDDVGGLVGKLADGTIEYCYNTGAVTGSGDNVGGLVGYSGDDYNDASRVIGESYNTGAVTGASNVGGLVGWMESGMIMDCYNTGPVTGYGIIVGGLVGGIMNFYASRALMGGSYNTGAVAGTDFVGGMIGYNDMGEIRVCYNAGAVTGSGYYIGGLAGCNSVGTINACVWDTSASGTATGVGEETGYNNCGRTTAQMMSANGYYGTESIGTVYWNFTDIWRIIPGTSYAYLYWRYSDTPQVVSGTLSTAGSGYTVSLVNSGAALASTGTGANGYYYFLLDNNTISASDAVLTYVSGSSSVKGSAVGAISTDNASLTGLNITADAVSVKSSGALDVTGLMTTAIGSLTNSGILYSVSDDDVAVSGNLSVTSNGAISQSGKLTVGGTTTLAAGSTNNIRLDKGGNLLTGAVSIISGNNVTLANHRATVLGPSTISGGLYVVAAGEITQNGALTVGGSTELVAQDSAGTTKYNIWLDDTNNALGGAVSVTSGNNVTLVNNRAIVLDTSIVSGNLGVTSSGAISQRGALSVSGTTSLAAGSGNDITLNNGSNSLTGAVSITSGNDVTLTNSLTTVLGASSVSGTLNVTASGDIFQNDALTVSGATTLAAGSSNSIKLDNSSNGLSGDISITSSNNVTLANNRATVLGASSVSGKLNVTASGDITQNGALRVSGTTTLEAGSNNITLNNSSNHLGGDISITSSNNVTLANNRATVLGGSSVSGKLNVTASGDITQSGALSVSGTTTLAASGYDITLDLANALTGAVGVTGGNNVKLVNNRVTVLGASTISGNFSVAANGAISQSGALTVDGTTTLAAGGYDITMNNGNNYLTGAVNVTSGKNVTLVNNRATVLGAFTVTGNFGVAAVGNITQSGALSVGGTITLAAGSSHDITLDNGSNLLTGAVSITSGNNVTLVNNRAAMFGVSNVSGSLSVAANGAVSQSGWLTVGGTTTLAAGGHDITLNNGNNYLTGAVNVTSGNNVILVNNRASVFGASAISGSFTVTAVGNITQSGAMIVGGLTTLAARNGYDITLDNGSNLLTGAVSVTSGNNVTLANSQATVLGTSSVSGNLSVTASGDITQSGALSVSGTTTLAASGYDITLDLANALTGAVGVTGNDVTLVNERAIVLGASNVSGSLSVTANGAISQSGALTVSGKTTLAAGSNNDITLNNSDNALSGAVGITSGKNVTVWNSLATALGPVNAAQDVVIISDSDLTINSGSAVTSAGGNITLAANGCFVNDSTRDAVTVDSGKYWRIYSADSTGDVYNGLDAAYNFTQYNTGYGDTILGTGNGLIYSETLTLTTGLTGSVSKVYDGTMTANITADNLSLTGSDSAAYTAAALSVDDGSAYDDKNVGTGKTVTTGTATVTGVEDSNGKQVYGFSYTPTNLSGNVGTISPASLMITASDQTKMYGTILSLGTTAFTASGLMNGDAVSGVTLTSSGAYATAGVGSYAITAGGATGSGLGNYIITYVNGALTVIKDDGYRGAIISAGAGTGFYGAGGSYSQSYGEAGSAGGNLAGATGYGAVPLIIINDSDQTDE